MQATVGQLHQPGYRAKRARRTPEEQLISEALLAGQHWQVCDLNGRSLLWERVG
ncbi:MAG: hypothetical protein HC856_06480 [Pseudanabaena sp. RU_4_16]|nr:hypothetical protein [Pseudanabaena sp. RU_4_16]